MNTYNFFGCEAGSLPIRYLDIPVHYQKLRNSEWNPIESRFEAKLGSWRNKLLSSININQFSLDQFTNVHVVVS
jgi:hypothetical protein